MRFRWSTEAFSDGTLIQCPVDPPNIGTPVLLGGVEIGKIVSVEETDDGIFVTADITGSN